MERVRKFLNDEKGAVAPLVAIGGAVAVLLLTWWQIKNGEKKSLEKNKKFDDAIDRSALVSKTEIMEGEVIQDVRNQES